MKTLIIALFFMLLSIDGFSQIDKEVDFEYARITEVDTAIKKDLEIFITYIIIHNKKGRVTEIKIIKEDCGGCTKHEKEYLIKKGKEILEKRKTNSKNKALKNMELKTALNLKLIAR